MKKNIKSISVKLAVLVMGTMSSYVMAQAQVFTCEERCTWFCWLCGLCGTTI